MARTGPGNASIVTNADHLQRPGIYLLVDSDPIDEAAVAAWRQELAARPDETVFDDVIKRCPWAGGSGALRTEYFGEHWAASDRLTGVAWLLTVRGAAGREVHRLRAGRGDGPERARPERI
jgi:hypothetical protein